MRIRQETVRPRHGGHSNGPAIESTDPAAIFEDSPSGSLRPPIWSTAGNKPGQMLADSAGDGPVWSRSRRPFRWAARSSPVPRPSRENLLGGRRSVARHSVQNLAPRLNGEPGPSCCGRCTRGGPTKGRTTRLRTCGCRPSSSPGQRCQRPASGGFSGEGDKLSKAEFVRVRHRERVSRTREHPIVLHPCVSSPGAAAALRHRAGSMASRHPTGSSYFLGPSTATCAIGGILNRLRCPCTEVTHRKVRNRGGKQAGREDRRIPRGERRGAGGLFNIRGQGYAQAGETAKAIADFTEAIRLGTGTTYSRCQRNSAACGLRPTSRSAAYASAIADYTEVIRREPKLASAHCGLGMAYGRQAEYEKAIAESTSRSGSTQCSQRHFIAGAPRTGRCATTKKPLPISPKRFGWPRPTPSATRTAVAPTDQWAATTRPSPISRRPFAWCRTTRTRITAAAGLCRRKVTSEKRRGTLPRGDDAERIGAGGRFAP